MSRITGAIKREIHSAIVILTIIIIIAACIFSIFYWDLGEYLTSQEKIQEYISGFGIAAPIIFALIQILQVIISPIPGNITTLAGGALFGFWQAFAISSIAITIGSLISFSLAKIFGRRLVVWMVGAKRVTKYVDIFMGKQRHMLAIMFLLPFFPDDILCFIAGITNMSFAYFLVLTLITRPWGLLFSALIGSGILSFNWVSWLIIGISIVVIMFISIKYGQRIKWRIIKIFRRKGKQDGNI